MVSVMHTRREQTRGAYQGHKGGILQLAGNWRDTQFSMQNQIAASDERYNSNRRPAAKSRGKAHRIHGAKWQEGFRERTGEITAVDYAKQLDNRLLAGSKDTISAMDALESTHTMKATTFCISRSIGFLTVNLFRTLYQFNNVVGGNIYTFFRVYLATLDCKMMLNERKQTAITNFDEGYAGVRHPETFVGIVRSLTFVPDMIRRILNIAGIVKMQAKTYVPKYPSRRRRDNEGLIVEPTNVTFSNLREVVETLADQNSPRAARRRFYANNPIPGCIRNE